MAKKRRARKSVASGPPSSAAGAKRRAPASSGRRFPIVGIGASAGGLEALEALFEAVPADTGMGFVVVVHLDPKHASILPELLQKATSMPVQQIADGMRVEPDTVYVIPPNRDLTILHGSLQLMEMASPHGSRLPIDSFFRALATDQERNAVGIVLSGTGTDGTQGVRAIKASLGMVMVQDEASAKFDGMPHSAIGTGLADYVLPPELMPPQLIKYTKHAAHDDAPRVAPVGGAIPPALQKIFVTLRARTEHDFSLYKKNTICRRIERRMNVHQIDDIAEYAAYLEKSEREAGILFKELLIGVTNFFRDPGAFEALKAKVLPKLLADKPAGGAVRAWVPGCASGEEAYSLAILLHEGIEDLGRDFRVQVFGTDIDEDAIAVARAGLYPESIVADVDPERLERYFTEEDDGRYRVSRLIREMLVFAPQNVIKDPPFTKLDLLSCRNLLIYLGVELQRKILPTFHYSLRPGGILFLGSSESVGQGSTYFAPVDRKWKIFRRAELPPGAHPILELPTLRAHAPAANLEAPEPAARTRELSVLELVETILQQSDTPPCAIITDACDVIYTHGRTGHFLELPEGRASVNIMDMARPGLKIDLAEAIRYVATHKQESCHKGLEVQHDGKALFVNLTVRPVLQRTAARGLMMVVFDETATRAQQDERPAAAATGPREVKDVEALARELENSRESLQTTVDELEASNEELKSANEELQSTNEELQSTNEELETSKEELQSLNEESATVNAELQANMDRLSLANDDLKNLLDSTEIATVFLDTDLRIRRFTPSSTEIIPLTAADAGRPISHLAPALRDTDLATYGRGVLRDLATREAEVRSADGEHDFVMRVRPYRTVANVIAGVVITFDDITERKRNERLVAQSELRYRLLFELASDSIALVESDTGAVVESNRKAHEKLGYAREDFTALTLFSITDAGSVDAVIERVKRAPETHPEAVLATFRSKGGEPHEVQLRVQAIVIDDKKLVLCTWQDSARPTQDEQQPG